MNKPDVGSLVLPMREPPSAPPGPWYHESVEARPGSQFCGVCRRLNLPWLLSNDVSKARSDGRKMAMPDLDEFSLPLGRLLDVLARMENCALCHLIIDAFRSDFGQEFQQLLDRAASVSPKGPDPSTGLALELPHGLANFSIRNVDDGLVNLSLQRSIPEMSKLDPGEAWFSLDTRPKDHGGVTLRGEPLQPYFIRSWLSAAFDGRTICHTLLHELGKTGQPGMGRELSPHVDTSLLQQWLNLDPQSVELVPDLNGFSVVDIAKAKLIPMPLSCKFAALSYVWGDEERNKTINTKATVGQLQMPGSIRRDDLALPATIRDALDLCHRLGVEYLWIDSVCITQDDEASKGFQIRHMDAVYQSAAFTIVAASGRNADAGLAGLNLSSPRHVRQQSAEVDGLSLISRPPRPVIRNEVWATRAWTLQEDYMSHRKLIFCDNLVLFRTSYGSVNIDLEENAFPLTCSDYRRAVSSIQPRSNIDTGDIVSVFPEYASLVTDYTSRQLTYSGDIINAFSGLLRHLSVKYQTLFTQGLPVSCLDLALLWLPASRVVRRTSFDVPSWSWAGWEGSPIRYEFRDAIHLGRIAWEEPDMAKLRQGIGGMGAAGFLDCRLRFSAPVAKFMLHGERVRLRDFGRAKAEHRNLRTYVIDDAEGNFSGAVCLHDQDIDPEYTLGHIGPFELVAVARTGPSSKNEQETPVPQTDDSDLQDQRSHGPYERDIREEYQEELQTRWSWVSLNTNDPYFFSQPSRRFYDYSKSWSIYDVLVILQKGDVAYRIGVGRCVAEAFWRNGAERRLINLG